MKQSHYVSGVLATSIGLTQLRAENPELTEGVGVKAQIVESFFGTDRYVPDPDFNELTGNTINIVGMPETAVLSEISSTHARNSARQFYGTLGVARDLGMDGQVIDSYLATPPRNPNSNSPTLDWLSFVIFNRGRDPNLSPFDRSTVSSHSYVFTADPANQLPALMQRMDYVINESDTTTVVELTAAV